MLNWYQLLAEAERHLGSHRDWNLNLAKSKNLKARNPDVSLARAFFVCCVSQLFVASCGEWSMLRLRKKTELSRCESTCSLLLIFHIGWYLVVMGCYCTCLYPKERWCISLVSIADRNFNQEKDMIIGTRRLWWPPWYTLTNWSIASFSPA